MASSYTTSLRLTLPQTGDLVGTWGATVNTGVTTLIDNAIAGSVTVTMTANTDLTLSVSNGATDQSRYMFINVGGGTHTTTTNVICPSVSKMYVVTNNTSGSQNIVFKTSAGTGVTIPPGARATLYCDGTNVTAFGMYGTSDSTLSLFKGTLSISGSLGVGTTSPSARLHVVDTNSVVLSEGTGGYGSFYAKGSGTNSSYMFFGNVTSGEQGRVTVENGGAMYFSNTSSVTERLRITSTGTVGIGTTSPTAKLDVNISTTAQTALVVQGNISGSGVNQLIFNGSNTAGASGNIIFWNNNGYSSTNAQISFFSSSSTVPDEFRLFQGSNAPMTFYTNGSERLRINGAGNVGVGVTPSSSWGAYSSVEIGPKGIAWSNTGNFLLSSNVIQGSSGTFIYRDSDSASYMRLGTSSAPDISWYGYGVAGAAIPAAPLGRLTIGSDLTFYSTTGTLGYAVGSGGSVTQITSKSTAVTLNRPTGLIITASTALGGNTTVSFVLNNSVISVTDMVVVTLRSGAASAGEAYQVWVGEIGTGTVRICLRNITGGSLSEQLFLQFAVISSDN